MYHTTIFEGVAKVCLNELLPHLNIWEINHIYEW